MSDLDFEWRLYYEDGTTFSNTDGEPWESPAWGVVVLAQPKHDPPYNTNSDYIMYRTDLELWTQCGDTGLDDHLVHYAHVISTIRKTRWVPDERFRALLAQARSDCGV